MSRVYVGLEKDDLTKLFNREEVECKFSLPVDNVYSAIIQLDDDSFGNKKTQADKIRSMNDEELFDFLFVFDGEAWNRTELVEWLQSEVSDGN